MNLQEFGKEIDRLKQTFGEKNYGQERVKLIFHETSVFSLAEFSSIVSDMIGSCRFPPLLPEFREAISKHRERSWGQKKKQYAGEAKTAYRALSKDESSLICQAIRGVILGSVSVGEANGAIDCVYGQESRR